MEIVDEEGVWEIDFPPVAAHEDQRFPRYVRTIYFTNRTTGEVLKGYCTSLEPPFENEIRSAIVTAKRYRDEQEPNP